MPPVCGGIEHGKPVLIDAHPNRAWISVEMAPHQREIAQRSCEEQVGSRTLCDKEARNVGMLADEVLCRGRIMILVERVDLGAMVEQESGDLDRTGEMQGTLAVAAL